MWRREKEGYPHNQLTLRGRSITVGGWGERVSGVTVSLPLMPHPPPPPSLLSSRTSRQAVSCLHVTVPCYCIWPCEPLPLETSSLTYAAHGPLGSPTSQSLSGSFFLPLLIISVAHPECPTFSTFCLWTVSLRPWLHLHLYLEMSQTPFTSLCLPFHLQTHMSSALPDIPSGMPFK